MTAITGSSLPVTQVMPAGMSALTWAFAGGECGSENWAGLTPANVTSNIDAFVAAGKKYIISTGGAAATFTCGSDAGFSKFVSSYMSPNLIGVDFDIEGGQDQAIIANLVARVKAAQTAFPNLRFSFTLATLGAAGGGNQLNQLGTWVMQAIQSAGLSWSNVFINLMVMDFGSASSVCILGSDGACDMYQSAVAAAESMHTYWSVPYSSIELTPMIGGNDTPSNIFTLANANSLSAYALSKGLGGMHHWSLDRDTDCPPGSSSATCNSYGTSGPLGFSNAFIAALGQPPVGPSPFPSISPSSSPSPSPGISPSPSDSESSAAHSECCNSTLGYSFQDILPVRK